MAERKESKYLTMKEKREIKRLMEADAPNYAEIERIANGKNWRNQILTLRLSKKANANLAALKNAEKAQANERREFAESLGDVEAMKRYNTRVTVKGVKTFLAALAKEHMNIDQEVKVGTSNVKVETILNHKDIKSAIAKGCTVAKMEKAKECYDRINNLNELGTKTDAERLTFVQGTAEKDRFEKWCKKHGVDATAPSDDKVKEYIGQQIAYVKNQIPTIKIGNEDKQIVEAFLSSEYKDNKDMAIGLMDAKGQYDTVIAVLGKDYKFSIDQLAKLVKSNPDKVGEIIELGKTYIIDPANGQANIDTLRNALKQSGDEYKASVNDATGSFNTVLYPAIEAIEDAEMQNAADNYLRRSVDENVAMYIEANETFQASVQKVQEEELDRRIDELFGMHKETEDAEETAEVPSAGRRFTPPTAEF